MPAMIASSANCSGACCETYSAVISLAKLPTAMPSEPSLRKSAASMPIALRLLPYASNAMPERAPISANRPLRSLWNTKFCTVSFETTRSGQPSASRSTGETPSDFAIGTPVAGFRICTPALAETSVKCPWPSFRYR